jgi:adenine-specific DNA-methyltransferase
MPYLNWVGKEKIVNHHKDVPYCVLDRKYSFDSTGEHAEDNGSENMIIHGDNLYALKSLLPKYEGKIKCIYIDPPYNTGNEGWVYNDNVNDPQIKKWLGEVVGKEGEDLSRHDKWLCMMYPRLVILRELLSTDGVIFVSIDDIEASYLRLMMDEIFGKSRFLAQFVWKSRQNKDNRNVSNISIDHEYVLCYGSKLNGCERKDQGYANPDNDFRGPWVSANMVGLADAKARPNLHYDLIDPSTGINYGCPAKGWRYDRKTMSRLISEQRIIWPIDPAGRPRKKQFLYELESKPTGFSSIIGEDTFTRDGSSELRKIWDEHRFDFPKSVKLVEQLIAQVTDHDSLVLDSFAGSGTTAHAVINLNEKDGGNRHFILVELNDYAEEITADRIKNVIKGYHDQEPINSSFSFYELGEPLLKDGFLNNSIPFTQVKQYIFYSETKMQYIPIDGESVYYLGQVNSCAYYFYYENDKETILNEDTFSSFKTESDFHVVYADVCTLSKEQLHSLRITFKKIPRDIIRV